MRKLSTQELNRMSVKDIRRKEKYPISIVLDNVRSAYNVGAIFRISDAFLIEKIFLCGITAYPPHIKIQKTALGATESVNWSYYKYTVDSIRELKLLGYKIIVVEQMDTSIFLQNFTTQAKEKLAFVFGNEVSGVDNQIIDLADIGLEIPQFGTKHSLNISVSVGIVLWNYIQKLC